MWISVNKSTELNEINQIGISWNVNEFFSINIFLSNVDACDFELYLYGMLLCTSKWMSENEIDTIRLKLKRSCYFYCLPNKDRRISYNPKIKLCYCVKRSVHEFILSHSAHKLYSWNLEPNDRMSRLAFVSLFWLVQSADISPLLQIEYHTHTHNFLSTIILSLQSEVRGIITFIMGQLLVAHTFHFFQTI